VARIAPDEGTVRRVDLAQVDLSDTRFQCRLGGSLGDLRRSLRTHGQLVPVVLWRSDPPYVVVDGFRRLQSLAELGVPTASAVIRNDLDERQAFSLAFLENCKRKSYSVWDKAHAVWRAVNQRRMVKAHVATELGLSVRQVERYLAMLDLSAPLREAVERQRITMAHATVLHRFSQRDPSEWITVVGREGLSARQLKRRLSRPGRLGRPRRYLQRVEGGFRMYPFRYDEDIDDREKARLVEALRQALAIALGRSPQG
jgi:ParB/RepB/Spo0J family partition protein